MPKTTVNHPIFARYYARMSAAMERGAIAEHRQALLAGLTGQVIEVGAGNGMNFAHYPQQVTRVLAVEPDPHLHQPPHRHGHCASLVSRQGERGCVWLLIALVRSA